MAGHALLLAFLSLLRHHDQTSGVFIFGYWESKHNQRCYGIGHKTYQYIITQFSHHIAMFRHRSYHTSENSARLLVNVQYET